MHSNEILHGDCLDIIDGMLTESIDLISFSPPYNQGRGVVGAFATGTYDVYDDQMNEDKYREELMRRLNSMVRILKPHGSMFIVIGQRAINRVLEWPFWITKIEGLTLHSVIIRRFNNSPQLRPLRFFYRHEPIFWLRKKWPPKFNQEYARWGDVWQISAPPKDKRHPAVMPKELVRKIIRACTNKDDIVFDPFNGIGTTCLVAKSLDRQYIGCDISEKYCEIATERLKSEK